MALDEAGVRDWWIVASDVSERALARTKAGRFRANEMRGLSPARAGRYLQRSDDGYRIVPELRERITTVHHNLASDEPPVGRGACNAVFCRNVFIYLRRERVTQCLGRIHERLAPRGVLLLGGSETLGRSDPRFRLSRFGEVFAYERIEPSLAIAPVAPAVAPASSARPAPLVAPKQSQIPLPTGEALRRDGESASRRADHTAAAAAFRKAVYLDRDDVAAHLGLGFSLEALGDADAGHRAFLAAQAALDRADAEHLGAVLEGYAAETVRLVLAAKIGGAGR
jgi:tetratricopeptide (TPR) repeat protein